MSPRQDIAPGTRRRNSHVFARDPHDWYLEPRWCSERLFDVEEFDRSAPLLAALVEHGVVLFDCKDTDGKHYDVIERNGFNWGDYSFMPAPTDAEMKAARGKRFG